MIVRATEHPGSAPLRRPRRLATAACVFAAVVTLLLQSAPATATGMAAAATYTEQYRPQFHFSPAQNWMNDPNGLLYYRGEYHLFFQYNPSGNTWGSMSWGHAVSKDLVHWTQLPVAIRNDPSEMVFSGSAVIDYDNTSGFGQPGNPAMVAVYTSARPDGTQQQAIAYSLDEGRSAGDVYIDRSASGNVTFDPSFTGLQQAPLSAADGVVHLTVLVDWSSVEVFAQDGQVLLTDQIFPDPSSTGIAAFAAGGAAELQAITVQGMRSAWTQ